MNFSRFFHIILLIIIFQTVSFLSIAQQFSRKEIYAPSNFMYRVHQTTDHGFLLIGRSYEFSYVIRLDSLFNQKWSNTYTTDSSFFIGRYIYETSDGGYLLFGGIQQAGNFNVAQGNVCAIKLDSSGIVESANSMGMQINSSQSEPLMNLLKLSDGNYLAVTSTPFDVIKISPTGNLIWDQQITNLNLGMLNGVDITEGDDGYYYAVANVQGGNVVVKMDTSGTIVNSRTFYFPAHLMRKIISYNNKVLVGIDGPASKFAIALIDSNLNVVLQNEYENSHTQNGIALCNIRKMSNNFVACGSIIIEPQGTPCHTAYILYDTLLELHKFTELDTTIPHSIFDMELVDTLSTIILNTYNDGVSQLNELILVDSLGRNTCFYKNVPAYQRVLLTHQFTSASLHTSMTGSDFPVHINTSVFNYNMYDECFITEINNPDQQQASPEIFPNPATTSLKINYEDNESINSISIFNAAGQEQLNFSGYKYRDHFDLNISSLAPGFYLIKIDSDDKLFNKRFVKE